MKHQLLHRLITFVMIFGMVAVPLAFSANASASDSGPTFTAASFVIKKTGTIGTFAFPEAPSYSPVECKSDAQGGALSMKPPGYLMVGGISSYGETAVVTAEVWQRMASGSYVFVFDVPIVKQTVTVYSGIPVYVPLLQPILLAVGPDYVYVYRIDWYAKNNGSYQGTAWAAYSLYHRTIDGSAKTFSDASICGQMWSPVVQPSATSGYVGSTLNFTIKRYPVNKAIPVTWDGKVIGSVTTDLYATATGSFKIPYAAMGAHTVAWNYGHWIAKITYTVKPWIALSPSTVNRGQTVTVKLRGYAKYEMVNIRWKKGASWVQVGQVKTSSTGSANISVKVPAWAPLGANSVRGDGSYGRAQTNAVTVSGAAAVTSSTVKATPSPSPAATKTSVATLTSVPATATPEPTSTSSPTEQPATPEVTEVPTETVVPVETSTPTVEPTGEPSTPTETPSPEPTGVPSETPEPAATEQST